MKLKSLTIKGNGYKNLKDTFPFEKNNGYIALIGLNGSGKSNLIEAISIIFDKLINNKGKDIPFDYSIEYEITDNTYIISKEAFIKNGKEYGINKIEFPSSIIACYSGEDKRLWSLAYEDYHYSYFKQAVKGARFNPSLLYIDKSCWNIAFLSLLCSEDPDVKSFLKDKLNVTSPADIEIDFTIDDTRRTAFRQHSALNWFDRICSNGKTRVNGNLLFSTDIMLAGKTVPNTEKAKTVFSFLYLLSQAEKKAKKNNIQRLIIYIKIKVNGICFDDLSEGEKKLILIECITKVLGDKKSLLLLDEPDAHTHIAMKKDLLKLISEFEGQTIMTTHSPMFLNKRWDGFNENNIFYMHDGEVENTELLKHLGDITDNEIDYFEGSFILSSKKILVTEGSYDIAYIGHAINKLSTDNPNYLKLTEQVAFLHAGGASIAVELYNQTLFPARGHYDNLVFIFDYDKSGFEGAEELKASITQKGDTKPIVLFYQDDYSVVKLRKPNDKDAESYMVEDLFDSDSYHAVTDKIHVRSHKDLRNITWNDVITSNKRPKGTPDAIKYYIQDNYTTFEKEWLQNFKPVLDKLLEVFSL